MKPRTWNRERADVVAWLRGLALPHLAERVSASKHAGAHARWNAAKPKPAKPPKLPKIKPTKPCPGCGRQHSKRGAYCNGKCFLAHTFKARRPKTKPTKEARKRCEAKGCKLLSGGVRFCFVHRVKA